MLKVVRYLIGLVFFISTTTTGQAQNSSVEFWPETDIWYRLSPSWRLSTFMPFTKYHESANRDFNIYLQVDYAFGPTRTPFFNKRMDENKEQKLKGWLARGGYMTGWSLYDLGESYTEDMLFAEIHKRIPMKGQVLFSQRIRGDTRWVGQDPKFSYRIRYRIMIEKEFAAGKTAIIPYINVEPFWDSRYSKVIKTRVIGGATFSRGPLVAFESNLTYQYDESYNTKHLYALNLILHLFFERHHQKQE